MNDRRLSGLCPILALWIAAGSAIGGEAGGMEFAGTGFFSATVGTMLGGTQGSALDNQCPCFISDYAQNAMYTGRSGIQWRPDTKLGLQGSAYLDHRRFSLTSQVVARAQGSQMDLEWLYATYVVDNHWTIQAGRKRLPMFYHSDLQDVGFALPWTHLPPQLYGWEVVNYSGVSVTRKDDWQDWNSTLHLLAGSEKAKESDYWKMYRGRQNRTDVKWQDILGGYWSVSRDNLEGRITYIQSKIQRRNVTGSWSDLLQAYDPATADVSHGPTARQQIYGVALHANHLDWILRTEFIHIKRAGDDYQDFAQILSLGRRMGRWVATGTWSNYREAPITDRPHEAHTDTAFTLRYDLDSISDVKIQLDVQHDRSSANYRPAYGDSRLLTVSYDRVF